MTLFSLCSWCSGLIPATDLHRELSYTQINHGICDKCLRSQFPAIEACRKTAEEN